MDRIRVIWIVLLLAGGCLTAAACGGGASKGSSPTTVGSGPPPAVSCPAAWADDWRQWSARVGMAVWCPSWLPSPIDGVIGGQFNTAASPGRVWQLGFVYREVGFAELIHVVFEGYPPDRWPRRCGDGPCFGGEQGGETIAGHRVTWYRHNKGSSSAHVAGVFRDGGNVYVVSMHIWQPRDAEQTKQIVRRMIAELVRVGEPV